MGEEENVAVNLANESEQLKISFRNLSFTVNVSGKDLDILKQLYGDFSPGRLCAIVGPSGAGKSSLLNILSGFRKPTGDSVLLINGKPTSQSFIRRNSSYIAQDLTFLGKLTTRETLNYAAKLKLPAGTTEATRRLIVANIVQLLGLEKCINNYVEKLSGGERKRLSIGEELITNPPIMIFDEPTSGLDSVSTVQVVTHLRDLAHSGRTVICVIHQPSSFVLELFDDIYVLSDGQCIYRGPIDSIVGKFQEAGYLCPQYYNRADFILEVASQQRQGNLDLLIWKAKENGGPVAANYMGIFILPATSMPMLIFCGFFIRYKEMPVFMKPLSYVPFFRYLYEGSFQALYGFGRSDLNCDQEFCYFKSISKILEEMDMTNNNYHWDIVAVVIWILILKIVSYFALRMKLKKLLS
ncbi:ATP-binding cassette sub-family G member 1-like [Lutzomyia longipalpis]|uniref:ATP-binding cassette sub-family G member 1-like n=1 Tax=Lutzomyia longipalpis TaxID=7200 RepID=UPI0024843E38|nr:ATP-binding cassette sub-family G member 1-like [Lutzomyia longipalpis]